MNEVFFHKSKSFQGIYRIKIIHTEVKLDHGYQGPRGDLSTFMQLFYFWLQRK